MNNALRQDQVEMYDVLTFLQEQFDELNQTIDSLTAKNLHQLMVIDEQSNKIKELETEAANIEADVKKLTEIAAASTKIVNNSEQLQKKNAQLEMLYKAEQSKVKDFKSQLKDFKTIAATPAKISKAIKDLKEKAGLRLKEAENWKKEAVRMQRELKEVKVSNAQSSLYRLSTFGDYHMMVWPHQIVKHGDTVKPNQNRDLGVLCLHASGNAKLMFLHDDELVAPHAVKGGFKPPRELQDLADSWLRKVRAQDWKVTEKDLLAFNNEG